MPEPDLFAVGGGAPSPDDGPPAPPPPPGAGGGGGLAINNPLNLRPLGRGKWPGQTGVSPSGFAIFGNIADGWAAADQNLQAKVRQHRLGTLAGIIGDPTYGWAPASDHNDPASYAARVAKEQGIAPSDDVGQRLLTDDTFRHEVLRSMAGVETGQYLDYGTAEPHLLSAGIGPVPAARYDAPGIGGAGQPSAAPPDPQAAAFGVLDRAGQYDTHAELGSVFHPEGQMPGQGIPSDPGKYYVTPDGHLYRSGDSTHEDYLPFFQNLTANQQAMRGQSGFNRLFSTDVSHNAAPGGVVQGALFDIPGSLNRLTGGYGDPQDMAWTGIGGGPSPQDQARNSLLGYQQERNQYDMLRQGDPAASGGRFFGQAAPITALTLGTGEGLTGLGPAGEFMAGRGGANLITQGASRATAGALTGAEAGALTSSTNDRSVASNVITGAALGGGLGMVEPAVVGGARRLVTGPPLTESAVTDLARVAMDRYGINLRAGQVRGAAGDRAAMTADSETLGSSPRFRANNDGQRQAFMRGVTSSYGDQSGDVTPGAMLASQDRLGAIFDDVAAHTRIGNTDALQTRLGAIVHDAQSVLAENEVTPLLRQVENIGSTVDGGFLSGESYQALTRKGAPLDRAMHSDNPNLAHYAGEIRNALDDALEASAAPADVQALREARFHYKNLMTVAKLAPKADVNGVISPALLRGAVNSNFKNAAFRGAGDLGELAQIGQTFMKEPPNSFSADRGAFRLGGADAMIGIAGETGGAIFHHPEAGALTLGGIATSRAVQVARARLAEARLGAGAANRLLNPAPLDLPTFTPLALPSAVIGGNKLLPGSPANP